ncbi:hypothetical protein [Ilumatobacter sp.]|uniref:hypothetical protein n=1 Tax=Ilumatobacter sp. TaxID=1967498 RepID=UPI003AF686C7
MNTGLKVAIATLLAAPALLGPSAAPTAQAAVVSDAPERVLDTRIGLGASQGKLRPGSVLRLRIDGVSQRGETVVLLNLTSDQPNAAGHISAWPCGSPEPETSILNVTPGRAIPNMVALEYTSDGVCFSSSTPVHLIADLTGVTNQGEIRGVNPQRLFDSRESRTLKPGREHRFEIAGTPGIAGSATAAGVNVTVVSPSADGWVLVKPCGAPSSASTINFRRNEVVPHFTFTALASGDLCVETLVETDLVIDTFAWMASDSELEMVTPNRALDTRNGHGGHTGALRNGQKIEVQIAGRSGVKTAADTATVNIVGVEPVGNGHITAWPCDEPEPTASVLNLWPGMLRSNQALLSLSDSGKLCLRAMIAGPSRVHLVVDVVGYTGGTGTPPPIEPPIDPPPPPPTGDGGFETLPVGATLPSGAECASRVKAEAEIRPENGAANSNRGGRAYANSRANEWAPFGRVDGDFSGTTDEIIQWAACKWGIDEDIARAQVIKESYWYQSTNGDGGESWGLGQVRDTAHQSAFEHSAVNARNSSAYNLDYTYASWRACYEGVYTWLNQFPRGRDYGPGDDWGCVGLWFTGRWYNGDDAYLNQPGDSVRWHFENRTWETPQFING